MEPEFRAWPKISRLNREIIVTEKIDGTNACVIVSDDGSVHAQSRKRIITPGDDNFGFAAWTQANAAELREGLGAGHHYGEWFGLGIQRGYGLFKRRFALFNTERWGQERPTCCHAVPELYRGVFDPAEIDYCVEYLRLYGSQVVGASHATRPEGVVVWHSAARIAFKVTLDSDESPKGRQHG